MEIVCSIQAEGIDKMKKLTVAELKNLIQFYFCSNKNKKKNIWKAEVVMIARRLFQENNREMPCDVDVLVVEEGQDESSQDSMSHGSTDDEEEVVAI